MPWLHGFAEHRARYKHFGEWMAAKGIAVAAIDLRGHGESQGKRGHTKSFARFLDDARVLVNWARKNFPDVPVILGSHSNGGLIAARFLQEEGKDYDFRAAVFSGPFLEVGSPVSPILVGIVKFLSAILPGLSFPTNIPPEHISHDAEQVRKYADDPMVFTTGTARWFSETLKNQKIALERAGEVRLPLLVMQGMDDKIVNPAASRRFYEGASSEDKQWVPYEGMFHEIINEVDREKVYADMYDWLNQRI